MRVSPSDLGRRWRPSFFLCLILSLSLWGTQAFAEQFQIADIRVEGLQRIAPGTIFTYLPVQVGDTVGDDVTGNIIRALYQTGFFDDVRVERDGNVLVLQVQERPAIAQIEFSGNRDLDEKALRAAVADIGLKEGRVFNRSVLSASSRSWSASISPGASTGSWSSPPCPPWSATGWPSVSRSPRA